MPSVGRICKLGVWDESIPGIEFDDHGISNYAKLFQTLAGAYPRGQAGEKEWNSIIQKIKEKGKGKKYDCIIGVSGGTDSCYLLDLAIRHNLRPLAVNLDNGWNSDIAVKNIQKLTTKLNIDLETYVVNYEEIKDLMRSYVYACLPWIDIPTDLAIKAVLYKIASRENISYVLRGNDFRSEGSQPDEWTYGDGRQLSDVHKKFGIVKLRTFPNYTFFSLVYYGFFRKVKSVYPFYYLEYNKKQAQQMLINKYGWEYYGGHHHENHFTKFAIAYWLYEKFGIDKRKITFSAQILSGEITRDYALEQLSDKPYKDEELQPMMKYFLKKLDITQPEFDEIMKSPNRSFKDFKSYYFLLTNLAHIANPILKLIFIHKPQSMYQAEMRKKQMES